MLVLSELHHLGKQYKSSASKCIVVKLVCSLPAVPCSNILRLTSLSHAGLSPFHFTVSSPYTQNLGFMNLFVHEKVCRTAAKHLGLIECHCRLQEITIAPL